MNVGLCDSTMTLILNHILIASYRVKPVPRVSFNDIKGEVNPI